MLKKTQQPKETQKTLPKWFWWVFWVSQLIISVVMILLLMTFILAPTSEGTWDFFTGMGKGPIEGLNIYIYDHLCLNNPHSLYFFIELVISGFLSKFAFPSLVTSFLLTAYVFCRMFWTKTLRKNKYVIIFSLITFTVGLLIVIITFPYFSEVDWAMLWTREYPN